jgi:antitoxin component HigA of HigAB toxin-antitoxin module
VASGRTIADAAHERVTIRSNAALREAMAEIDSLLGRRNRTKTESTRLGVLSDAVRDYERAKMPVARRSPAERLRTLLELHGMESKRLAVEADIRPEAIDAILAGGEPSEPDATALARFFALDATAFRN